MRAAAVVLAVVGLALSSQAVNWTEPLPGTTEPPPGICRSCRSPTIFARGASARASVCPSPSTCRVESHILSALLRQQSSIHSAARFSIRAYQLTQRAHQRPEARPQWGGGGIAESGIE